MNEIKSCPKCGGAVAAGGTGGLCPKCLLMGAEADAEMTAATVEGGGGRAWVPPTVEELAGAVPGCEVEELIGRGGMGAVYRAKQGELDRVVAVKVLPKELGDEGGFAERFRREAQVMGKLDHPNIVKVFDFGQAASGHFYFVMEFVEGMDLQRVMRSGQVGEKEALAIVGQICDALQYAHGEGFVHRDIKPANLMLAKDGKVKVGDFGIARVLGERDEGGLLTAAGQGLGTAVYAAPEQLSGGGAIDHRADIYSLGVVLYEMLTGEVPRGAFDLPSERVRVDVRLDEVVVRAMKSSPERRYQAVGEVKADVETIAGGAVAPPAAAEPAGVAGGGQGRGSRRGLWGCLTVGCIVGGLLLVLAVPVIVWMSYRSLGAKEQEERARAEAVEQTETEGGLRKPEAAEGPETGGEQ